MIHIFDRIGGNKWAILVIDALGNRPMRFNEVLRSIAGTSHRMLTLTLKALDRDGLVVRRVFATIPPKVEYKLTPLGRSLLEPVRAPDRLDAEEPGQGRSRSHRLGRAGAGDAADMLQRGINSRVTTCGHVWCREGSNRRTSSGAFEIRTFAPRRHGGAGRGTHLYSRRPLHRLHLTR